MTILARRVASDFGYGTLEHSCEMYLSCNAKVMAVEAEGGEYLFRQKPTQSRLDVEVTPRCQYQQKLVDGEEKESSYQSTRSVCGMRGQAGKRDAKIDEHEVQLICDSRLRRSAIAGQAKR